MRTVIFMRQEGKGCSKCIQNYSAVYIEDFLQICVESQFTKLGYFSMQIANVEMFNALYLIDNCEEFYLQEPLPQAQNQNESYYQDQYDNNIPKLKCKKCVEGYFIDATGNFCLKSIKNCKQAQSVSPT